MFCAGWKGWPSEQALAEDLNYILAAKIGHIEMLQMIFGAPEKKPPVPKPGVTEEELPKPEIPVLTSNLFDEMFGEKQH